MKRFALILFSLLMVLSACKKSVEGETSKFERNKKSLQELSGLYPAWSDLLNDKLSVAEGLWADAAEISVEEEKIAKMAEANDVLSGGVVGKLRSVDNDIQELQKKISEMNRVAKDNIDRQSAASASDGANININNVTQQLRNGASDEAGAMAILNRASTDLDRSMSDCKRVIDSAKAKTKQGNKNTNAKGGSTTTGNSQNDQPTTWKCSYCGKNNPSTAHECGGCGAQH
ncbi:MAG: zinc ribbon domain-containing protein [Bacteroidia bacterium]|nr:zinc ribbon domain-containing protein [Bacteroidia bacterium]